MTRTESPKFRKTKSGEWVAFGPTSQVRPGQVTVTKANGERKTVQVARCGRPFQVDGTECVYGYIESRQARRSGGGRGWECDEGHRHHVTGCFCCENQIGM